MLVYYNFSCDDCDYNTKWGNTVTYNTKQITDKPCKKCGGNITATLLETPHDTVNDAPSFIGGTTLRGSKSFQERLKQIKNTHPNSTIDSGFY